MKITFKTETKILKSFDFKELNDELEKELRAYFDDKPILKYEITFKEGVLAKQFNSFEDISERIADAITITIAED